MKRIKYIQKTTNDDNVEGYTVFAGYIGQKPDTVRHFHNSDVSVNDLREMAIEYRDSYCN